MPIRRQNLAVGIPASLRITSRSAKAALRALFPHPQLDRRLTQSLGQVSDLGLQLLLTRRQTRPASSQRGLARLDEVGLPAMDRLLTDLLLAGGLTDRHFAGQHREHNPRLLL